MAETWTIGEVARRADLAVSAIRYYESERLLERAERRSGRRIYDDSVFDRLALIRLAQRAGFSLDEIRTLLRGFPEEASAGQRWNALIERKHREISGQLAELQHMLQVLERLKGCPCPDLDACGAAARAGSWD